MTRFNALLFDVDDTLLDFQEAEDGAQKPDPHFFQYVFNRLEGFSPEKGMIVGDSLTSDIQGGLNAGMATCWFNPTHARNDTQDVPSLEIHRLDDLLLNLDAETTISRMK